MLSEDPLEQHLLRRFKSASVGGRGLAVPTPVTMLSIRATSAFVNSKVLCWDRERRTPYCPLPRARAGSEAGCGPGVNFIRFVLSACQGLWPARGGPCFLPLRDDFAAPSRSGALAFIVLTRSGVWLPVSVWRVNRPERPHISRDGDLSSRRIVQAGRTDRSEPAPTLPSVGVTPGMYPDMDITCAQTSLAQLV